MNVDNESDHNNPDLASHVFLTMTLSDFIGPNGALTLCKDRVDEIIKDNNLRQRLSETGARTKFPEPRTSSRCRRQRQGERSMNELINLFMYLIM